MDTISGSCEMNDSKGGSFVTDFYHFTHFSVCFPNHHYKKNLIGGKIIGSVGLLETQVLFCFGLSVDCCCVKHYCIVLL